MAVEKMILLKGKGHHEEGNLGGVASPGMALRLQANGTYLQESKTRVEALKSGPIHILKEDALQGKTVLDAYASGARAFIYVCMSGDHILALVKAGQTVALGDDLNVEAGGSGLFVQADKVGPPPDAIYQLTALEGSGGALAANTLLKCRVN